MGSAQPPGASPAAGSRSQRALCWSACSFGMLPALAVALAPARCHRRRPAADAGGLKLARSSGEGVQHGGAIAGWLLDGNDRAKNQLTMDGYSAVCGDARRVRRSGMFRV